MRLLTLVAGVLACFLAPARAPAQTRAQALVQPQTPAPTMRGLTLVDGALPPAQRLIVATKGEALRWRIVSTLPGEVHVHALRVSVALQPGRAGELAFTAHATGRFRVEWHAAGGAPGDHHAPPLAMLEVRPR